MDRRSRVDRPVRIPTRGGVSRSRDRLSKRVRVSHGRFQSAFRIAAKGSWERLAPLSNATNYIRRRRLPRSGDAAMPSPQKPRSLTIAHGEIDASDKTTSLLFPRREQAPRRPFERFAATMTTSRTKLGRHGHQAEEDVVYLVDREA